MQRTFDPYLFSQIGLDSGAITMLGSVVHSFGEPGEYRGTVRSGKESEATFYVSVDKNCAVAQVNIDLAKLAGTAPSRSTEVKDSECCGDDSRPDESRFVVHPKGYAVFHVSGGRGGYSVTIRRADENREVKAYDTQTLQPGDTFAAVLLRPGVYSIRNLLLKAAGEVTVSYPVIGKAAYRPPAPLNIEVGDKIEPRTVSLHPAQGLNLHVKSAARIKIELVKPDDGPRDRMPSGRAGLKRSTPVKG
jgi:hypothetical protein